MTEKWGALNPNDEADYRMEARASESVGNPVRGYHGILVRLPDERRSRWLGSGFASVTRLRIHAGMTTAERAEQVAAELRDMNPGVTFTVKPVLKER